MRVLLVAVAGFLWAAQASAQFPSEPAHPPDYKDPNTAMLFSAIVPGGGQLWAGDSQKGTALLGIGIGGLALSVFSPNTAGTYLGIAAYLGSTLYGVLDAPSTAAKHNATLKRLSSLPVSPYLASGPSKTTRVGLLLSLKSR